MLDDIPPQFFLYQPTHGKPYKEPTITVKGQRLQVVDKFTYLGITFSRLVHIDDEVNARIAKTSTSFGRLRGRIWDRSGIRTVRLPRLGKRELILVLFVRLFDLRLFGCVCFLFLFVSGMGCGL